MSTSRRMAAKLPTIPDHELFNAVLSLENNHYLPDNLGFGRHYLVGIYPAKFSDLIRKNACVANGAPAH